MNDGAPAKRKKEGTKRGRKAVVLLQDLAPRKDAVGGAGQILFGQQPATPPPCEPKPAKP